MSDSKTIEEWEIERGCIITTEGLDIKQQISGEDFDAIGSNEKIGVNHHDRVEFLKNNGYKVTRQNMVDASLSAQKPAVEEQSHQEASIAEQLLEVAVPVENPDQPNDPTMLNSNQG